MLLRGNVRFDALRRQLATMLREKRGERCRSVQNECSHAGAWEQVVRKSSSSLMLSDNSTILSLVPVPHAHYRSQMASRMVAPRRSPVCCERAIGTPSARAMPAAHRAWPFGHIRAVTSDRCYVRVQYRDRIGCGTGLFAIHDSGKIEAVTAGEVRSVRQYRSWC